MKYEIVMAIVILALAIIVLVFWTYPVPTEGTLVLDNKEFCHGELHKRRLYATQYHFECEDGRTIMNLTNFSIK